MLSTYHLHTTYAIPGPTTPKAAMYENVAANDYASINYRYDVVLRFIDVNSPSSRLPTRVGV